LKRRSEQKSGLENRYVSLYYADCQTDRLNERLEDAEQHKLSLKKQIDNYINDENTMQGENAQVKIIMTMLTLDPTCPSR